jgi:GxxExxY protein
MSPNLTHAVIGAAIEVHRSLGPGLLESAYEACLAYELSLRGLQAERQIELPIHYKGQPINAAYRIDLLVNQELVLEIKAVDALHPIHEAQLLTYLKLGRWPLGLLINFNVPVLKEGIRRLILKTQSQSKVD